MKPAVGIWRHCAFLNFIHIILLHTAMYTCTYVYRMSTCCYLITDTPCLWNKWMSPDHSTTKSDLFSRPSTPIFDLLEHKYQDKWLQSRRQQELTNRQENTKVCTLTNHSVCYSKVFGCLVKGWAIILVKQYWVSHVKISLNCGLQYSFISTDMRILEPNIEGLINSSYYYHHHGHCLLITYLKN